MNPLSQKLNSLLSSHILELREFAGSETPSLWIPQEALCLVAEILYQDKDLKLEWLENLTVVQFEKIFVVTYFLRSFAYNHSAILRLSLSILENEEEIKAPSVSKFWPMAEPMEREIQEMFGITFSGLTKKPYLLPKGWARKSPMRKQSDGK